MKKRIVVLGGGESGVGAASLAKAKGYDVFLSDSGILNEKYRKVLLENDINFEEGKHTPTLILTADEIIKSPGIPESVPIMNTIFKSEIKVIDEIEFAARFLDAKFIAISGTNGKTTTTLLTYHLLKEAGIDVGLAGNVGQSLAMQVIDKQHEYYVLELSSFQLDYLYEFQPEVAILLNITPDHLDRYSYDLEKYVASKFRIANNMTASEKFIYFNEDNLINTFLKKQELAASKYPVSLNVKLSKGAYKKDSQLKFVGVDEGDFSIALSEVSLRGSHNMINIMCAVMAARFVGVDEGTIKASLKTFINAPHRLEFVADVSGIDFINDSKATNVDAVSYALASFDRPLIWILGGIDKGNDYGKLDAMVKKNVKAIVCLGKENEKIKKAFSGQVDEIKETTSAKEAVQWAYEMANTGDIVLLSPACASFDLFDNYEERGDKFKEAVRELKKVA